MIYDISAVCVVSLYLYSVGDVSFRMFFQDVLSGCSLRMCVLASCHIECYIMMYLLYYLYFHLKHEKPI